MAACPAILRKRAAVNLLYKVYILEVRLIEFLRDIMQP
jgi:hypothetical protein